MDIAHFRHGLLKESLMLRRLETSDDHRIPANKNKIVYMTNSNIAFILFIFGYSQPISTLGLLTGEKKKGLRKKSF